MLTIHTTEEARQERTTKLLTTFRSYPDEWKLLKGVLCMTHGMDCSESIQAGLLFDSIRIAERMDEILNEQRAALLKACEAVGV